MKTPRIRRSAWFLLAAWLLPCCALWAVEKQDLRLDPDVQQTLQAAPPTGIATFAAGKQTALTFSTRLRDALHLGNHNSFRKLQENTDTNGKQHSRYRQYYAGVPLYGEQVLI